MRFNDLLKCFLNCDVANALKKKQDQEEAQISITKFESKVGSKGYFREVPQNSLCISKKISPYS